MEIQNFTYRIKNLTQQFYKASYAQIATATVTTAEATPVQRRRSCPQATSTYALYVKKQVDFNL